MPEREQELSAAVDCLSDRLQLAKLSDLSDQIDCVDKRIWQAWEQLSGELHVDFKRYLAMRFLKKEIKDIVFGYGPLEDLLHTPTISEIMVVDREHIYIEKNGVLESSGRRFISDEVTQAIIERIVAQVGRRIDKSRPWSTLASRTAAGSTPSFRRWRSAGPALRSASFRSANC